MREGKLSITPGYDGVYGVVHVFSGKEYHTPQQKELL
jgi:PHP family Zn ribbon phosphoesterase